jgi:hypothetical protein
MGNFTIEITGTNKHCPAGERAGSTFMQEGKIPVLSCEGPCIRGEIARLAANLVAKEEPFRRGCHGELITVPGSAIDQWIRTAGKVVLIDGCFLRCQGRVIENLLGRDKLAQFDAHSYYGKYSEYFDIDAVPEAERQKTARLVADAVLAELRKTTGEERVSATADCSAPASRGTGCGCS